MERNDDQVCVLGVFFPCPTNSRATAIKDKIEEIIADIPEAKVELTLRSGGGRDIQPQRIPRPIP